MNATAVERARQAICWWGIDVKSYAGVVYRFMQNEKSYAENDLVHFAQLLSAWKSEPHVISTLKLEQN